MRKLMIICGTGVATSTVVNHKVSEWLKSKGLTDVQVFQSKVADEISHLDDYDVIVSTTLVPDSIKDKVIMGVPLLTGIGQDAIFAEIEKRLTDAKN